MNYEKEYKAALERARNLHKDAIDMEDSLRAKMAEIIFPELKESEDEKIRKALISILKSDFEKDTTIHDISVGDIIAWLEKQGDFDKASYEIAEKEKYDFVSERFIKCRKSFDEFKENTSYWFEYVGNDTYIGRSANILNKKFHITPRQLYHLFTQQHCANEETINIQQNDFAPKSALEAVKEERVDNANCIKPAEDKLNFNIGQWVVRKDGGTFADGRKTVQITKIDKEQYWFDCETWLEAKDIRLWTIQDAEYGDVLALNDEVFIYSHRKLLYNIAVAHCFVDSAGRFYLDGEFCYTEKGNSIHPATKEQRELLFQKIKEADYEWDADNKCLLKI